MKPNRLAPRLLLGVLILLPAALAAGRADACSCLPPDLSASYQQHSDVMQVRVLARRNFRDRALHMALVERTYKGCTQKGDYVVLTSPTSSAACGIPLDRGRWLVTASAGRPGTFSVASCGFNRRWRDVTRDQRHWLNGRFSCCGESCGCVDGSDPVLCFADPCSVSTCGEGECTANYCGGCNAEWTNDFGQQVCTACETDDDCSWGQACTDEGCRSACGSDAECPRGSVCGADGGCVTEQKLSYFTTCGAPVCGGPRATSGVPPCGKDVVPGEACSEEGALCDPGSSCGELVVCAAEDPRGGPGGCPISRRAFKRDIDYLEDADREALAAELMSFRLATWNYRQEPAQSEPRLGFIIEDVEPSPSVDSPRDQVDLYGYLSMAVAALQSQQQQIEALRTDLQRLRPEDAVCQE